MMHRVIDEYRRLAADYDRKYADYNAKTLDATLSVLGNVTGKTLLDIGCGTGLFLELVSSRFKEATLFGVDIVSEMLDIAQYRLDKNIHLARASATNLPFESNSIDMVVSTSAFHYFPDQPKAIQEIHRILKPGGKVIITDWCHDYMICKLCDIYLRLSGKGHYKMLGSNQCLSLLQQDHFEDISLKKFKANWAW